MRIAFISHGLSDGGAERVASIVANHYASLGHDVLYLAVLSPEQEYHLDPRIKYHYVEIGKSTRLTRVLQRSMEIDRLIREFRADVAVSFLIQEAIVTSIRKTVPLVYSLRIDPGVKCRKPVIRAFMLHSYRRAKRVIFQTRDARDFFEKKIRDKGVVIYNPLTQSLPYWQADSHEKRIITACRLTAQKNLPMLIRAFAAFHKLHPDYRLEIYGKGEELENLQALTRTLCIEDAVHFPGHSTKIHEIMANSAMFVLSSDFEGLSNSMLEALAIGVPSVCTDCPPGGAREFITDGIGGMLVPVGDVEALTKKLCLLADDPDLCTRISAEAIKVRDRLSPQQILSQWADVLTKE